MRLPTIKCVNKECGRIIESDEYVPKIDKEGAPKATGYDSCLRRCEECGFGYSNANTADASRLTIILRNPFAGIPKEITVGCASVLANGLCVKNRGSKALKFASMNSEDHVTWTVFRQLQITSQIARVIAKSNILNTANGPLPEPTVLLWGAPVPMDSTSACELQLLLKNICCDLGENRNSLSEPDVILDFGAAGVVFIEVKLRSANDTEPASYAGTDGKNKWDKYLTATDAFRDAHAVRKTGLYELTRNWRLAWALAGDRPMRLVNLGPETLIAGEAGNVVELWQSALKEDGHRSFLHVSWTDLLERVDMSPPWLSDYLRQRGVIAATTPH